MDQEQTRYRMTRQRRAILDELSDRKDHPTAEELFRVLREEMDRISLSTVYRNLEVLQQQGLVRILEFPGMPRRFDADISRHYHIRCVECGSIMDIDPSMVPNMKRMGHEIGSHKILAMRLEFDGICRQCQLEHDPSR